MAHWVATGEPLFGWEDKGKGWSCVVRAVGGALTFVSNGLHVDGIGDGNSFSNIAVASRALPASAEATAGKPELKN